MFSGEHLEINMNSYNLFELTDCYMFIKININFLLTIWTNFWFFF